MKKHLRTIALFAAFIAGFALPQAARLSFLISWVVMGMMFFALLRIDLGKIRLQKEHFYILALNLASGLGFFYLTGWLCRDPALAQAAFFAGISPTATAAAVVMTLLGGRAEFVLGSMLLTTLAAALLSPLLIPLTTGNAGGDIFLHVAGSMCFVLLIPAAAVLIFKKRINFPRLVSAAPDCAFSLWILGIFLIISKTTALLSGRNESGTIIVLAAGISLLNCIFNFVSGRLISRKLPRECSQSLGQKNTSLTVYLALSYGEPGAVLGPAFYVVWHNSWNAIQLWMRNRKNHD